MQIISSDSSCGRRLNSFPIRKGRILNIKNNESKNKRSKRSERLVVEAGVEASFVFEIARDISVGAACYWVSDEIAQRLQRQQISDSDSISCFVSFLNSAMMTMKPTAHRELYNRASMTTFLTKTTSSGLSRPVIFVPIVSIGGGESSNVVEAVKADNETASAPF